MVATVLENILKLLPRGERVEKERLKGRGEDRVADESLNWREVAAAWYSAAIAANFQLVWWWLGVKMNEKRISCYSFAVLTEGGEEAGYLVWDFRRLVANNDKTCRMKTTYPYSIIYRC